MKRSPLPMAGSPRAGAAGRWRFFRRPHRLEAARWEQFVCGFLHRAARRLQAQFQVLQHRSRQQSLQHLSGTGPADNAVAAVADGR